jgi:hypothetical protein
MGSQSLLVSLNQYLQILSQRVKEASQGMTEELDDQQWLVVLVKPKIGPLYDPQQIADGSIVV